MNESMSYELNQKLDQRGYEGQMALGYLDAINDLMKIEDRRYKDQPQLNENQQELLDDLKYVYSWQHSHAWDLFYYLVENDSEMFEEETLRNFQDMPEDDSLVVLEAFSRWVLERGKIGE